MEEVGLSMAMGAFLAGVLLAESNFRHQLEADIEPFRGMLLGLFFMSVGMSIDGGVVREQWLVLVARDAGVVAVKSGDRRRPVRRSSGRHRATRCAAARCSRPPANSPSCSCRVAVGLGLLTGRRRRSS